jgi:hypothetical protein
MAPNVINGHVRVIGCAPDGDTVRFLPDDPADLPRSVHLHADGSVTVRLDGAEALESWYTPMGSRTRWHQPLMLAEAAAASVLEALSFTDIRRDDVGRVLASRPELVPAHLAVRSVDPKGRLIALLVAGRLRGPRRPGTALRDDRGADLQPYTPTQVRGSVNWMLLRQGLAYPWLSVHHLPEVRAEFVAAARHAQEQHRGIWPHDVSLSGFSVRNASALCEDLVMLPRLFRRIADHCDGSGVFPDGPARPGTINLTAVRRQVGLRTADVIELPGGAVRSFDTLVEAQRQRIRMLAPAEALIMLD